MSQTESPLETPAEAMAAAAPSPARADAFAAARFPEFRHLMAGTFLFTIALLIQEVVIGYELYKLTHDPLVLGLIGLAEAIPFISLALFGGHVADRSEKRRILLITMAAILAGSVVLWWVMRPAMLDQLPRATLLAIIYGVTAALGLARGFLTPAAGALKAFVVPREHYANSAAWSSTAWQAGPNLGPVSGGFL